MAESDTLVRSLCASACSTHCLARYDSTHRARGRGARALDGLDSCRRTLSKHRLAPHFPLQVSL